MSAGFTPGPWAVGEYGDLICGPSDGISPNPIAEVFTGKAWPHSETWKRGQADKHLIAAAPALYEAVQALVECFIERGPFDEPLGSSEQAPSINAGIAALKQARGEQ